jgi:hypothetical protein
MRSQKCQLSTLVSLGGDGFISSRCRVGLTRSLARLTSDSCFFPVASARRERTTNRDAVDCAHSGSPALRRPSRNASRRLGFLNMT